VKLLFPGGAGLSKAPPLSAVTVWATESMLSTLTFEPGLTDAGVVNEKLLIEMTDADDGAVAVWAADVDDELGAAPLVEPFEPQAARATAQAQAITARPGRRTGGNGAAGWGSV
jgi:hypothetical protein